MVHVLKYRFFFFITNNTRKHKTVLRKRSVEIFFTITKDFPSEVKDRWPCFELKTPSFELKTIVKMRGLARSERYVLPRRVYIYISRGQNLCLSNYFQQLYTFLNSVDSSICEIHPRSKIWTVRNLISCWA